MHVVPNTDESWYDVAQKKFYAHTDFEKSEGTLPAGRRLSFHLQIYTMNAAI